MTKHFYEFGSFRIDLDQRLLLRDGQLVPLTPKAFETLLVLVQNAGHVVAKDELMNQIWPDTFVEEVGLARNISVLRKVLEEGSERHHYIETVPKRGYRFTAEVREREEEISEGWAKKQQPAPVVHRMGNRSDLAAGKAPRSGGAPSLSASGLEAQNISLRAGSSITGETTTQQRRLPHHLWAIASLALLGAVIVGWWLVRLATRPMDVPLTAVPLTSYPGKEREPSLSPDGNQVAFSWNGKKQDNFDIYVKLIGSESHLLRLTSAPEADTDPAWSPDGRSIAFIREGPAGKDSVILVSPLGPPERKVAEIIGTGGDWPRGLAWTPDGKSLVVTDTNSESEPLGLFLLSAESGQKRSLTSPPEKAFVDSQPCFSPDGRTLAFIRQAAVSFRDIYLLALAEDLQPIGEPKRLTFENRLTFRPVWTQAGNEIIFSSGRFLDPNLFRIVASGSGKPQRLASVGENGYEAAICHRAQRLVYTQVSIDVNIWRLEVPGPDGKISQPMKLTSASTRADRDAQFSLDGEKIVFNSNRTGNFEIWMCDSDGSNPRPITSLGRYCGSPHLSPDGQRVTFDSALEGQWEIYVTNANGGKPQRLTTHPAIDALTSWSRDGRWVYFFSDRSGENQIWKVPAGGGAAVPVTRKGGFQAVESPDGQWVYYTKSDGASSLWRVPKDGGEESQVLESVDKRAFAIANEGIYFVPKPESLGRYTIQFFNFATKKIRTIFTIDGEIDIYLSSSSDGRWILYSQVDQDGSDLTLVDNFR